MSCCFSQRSGRSHRRSPIIGSKRSVILLWNSPFECEMDNIAGLISVQQGTLSLSDCCPNSIEGNLADFNRARRRFMHQCVTSSSSTPIRASPGRRPSSPSSLIPTSWMISFTLTTTNYERLVDRGLVHCLAA